MIADLWILFIIIAEFGVFIIKFVKVEIFHAEYVARFVDRAETERTKLRLSI